MAKSETCSRCGEEIRFGVREPIETPRWLHRDEVDHHVRHGQPVTEGHRAAWEVERHRPQTRPKMKKVDGLMVDTGEIETYAIAELEAKKLKGAARDEALAELDDEEGHDEIEPVEVYARPIEPKDCPQGVRNVLKKIGESGWTIVGLTYARGPYLGSSGKSLGVSDSILLRVRLDGSQLWGVASWRDGKSDFAYIPRQGRSEKVTVTALKKMIEENPHG